MSDQKRGILITIAAIIFIASTVYLNFFSGSEKKQSKSADLFSVLSTTNKQKTGLYDISEGESIPNWKKAVLAQAAIDDPSGSFTQTNDPNQDNLNNPNNITAQYAKNVYAANAIISQNTEVTPTQKTEIAKSILEQEALKASAKAYVFKDLKTKPTTLTEVKKYGNIVGAVLILSLQDVIQYDDLAMIKEYGSSKNINVLKPYNEKIDALTILRDSLLAIEVPTTAILYHLNLLNAVEMYRQTLINLRGVEDDPLRASLGMSDYSTIYQNFFVSVDGFKEYFNLEGVSFSKKEPGYFISNGIIQ